MRSKVAIQGDKASFHDIAASQIFGDDSSRFFCDSFRSTFCTLVDDDADYALCAIENSLYGSINEVYDLLLKHKLQIIGEVYLRIEQCLIGLPDAKIEDITKVYSHPVALAQCERYLDVTLSHAEREEHHDTAASVELVKQLEDPTVAAIASKESAALHGLEVLANSIETNKQNYTRFVALSKSKTTDDNPNKTSLVLELDHTPGALYRALGVFANNDVNLTKLQSRPITDKAWHYIFYIDIEVGNTNKKFQTVIDALTQEGCSVTQLGSYKSADNLANLADNATAD